MDTLLAVCGFFITAVIIKHVCTPQYLGTLPPGPKGWPVIGNLFDMPREKIWLTFSKWGETYGDISSVTVFGQPIIIINSQKVASDLLDKKSAIYSDRPILPMGGELIGWKNTLPLVRYGNTFRHYRKLFHQLFGTPAAMARVEPFEESSTRHFLQEVVGKPDDFISHIRTHIGTVALKVVYGYDAKGAEDRMIGVLDNGMKQFAVATAPGGFFVDLLPSLRYIPSWFPGGGFHDKARSWARTLETMGSLPYQWAKEQFNASTAKECFTSAVLTPDVNSADDHVIKWTASSVCAGGFTTRNAFLKAFFLHMAQNPEAQKKAQSEIDSVVGNNRLPGYADRPNLPYVNALCKEVLRFHSVVPTGLPHVVMEDDTYNGYVIPKGAIIIANIWNMHHNEKFNAQADTFMPERFLQPKEDGKESVYDCIFGFGRRICPGRFIAENTLFIVAAMALASLDISKEVDTDGIVIEPVSEALTGSVSQPAPFRCSIKPRSEDALALINALEY